MYVHLFCLELQHTFERAILDTDKYQPISTNQTGASTLGMYVATYLATYYSKYVANMFVWFIKMNLYFMCMCMYV